MGGRAAANTLSVSTCRDCNNTCGLFVDGQFARSWLITNHMAYDALKYVDLDLGTPLPLIYLGSVQKLDPYPYEHADLWLSMCRSRILHLHSHGGRKWLGQAGGNPIERKRHPGTAIFINAANDFPWARVGLRSFYEKFLRERRMTYGVQFSSEKDLTAFGSSPDAAHKPIVDRYLQLDIPDEPISFEIAARMDFDQRFIAKVALGIGFKYLGETFLCSPWADLLSETLWAKSAAEQERLRPIGIGMLDTSNQEVHRTIRWEGGVTLVLMPAGNFLTLQMSIFGQYFAVIVSDDPFVWKRRHDVEEGLAWVLIPQREFCEGPISFPRYLSHKLGHEQVPRLVEAASWRADPTIPPLAP